MTRQLLEAQKHIHVACAIIERDGLVLAAQRSAAMNLPLKWEFPGGKIDSDESPEECLIRELVEEMDVNITVVRALNTATHDYPTFTVTLYPYICTITSGEIRLHEHKAIQWLRPHELCTLDWAAADLPVIDDYLRKIELLRV